jgi:SAM-dependent methyltransferase
MLENLTSWCRENVTTLFHGSPRVPNQHLSGSKLYGDDFGPEEIARWFEVQREGYHSIVTSNPNGYTYSYHAFNVENGFRYLPDCDFNKVLGIGSAYGEEFEPILNRCREVTILEPSHGFVSERFVYVSPDAAGSMPFADNTFDLITCFGVLHHVPNVSYVVSEIARVLRPGAFALVREPIVSMGDWRYPRKGLTSDERGIPIAIFRRIILKAGLTIVREKKCMFSLLSRLKYVLREFPYNIPWVVKLDAFIAPLPIWFQGYHPGFPWQKLRPLSVYYVLSKPRLS